MDPVTLDNDLGNSMVSAEGKAAASAGSGWMKFVAIVSMILSGFGVLGGIFTLIASPVIGLVYLALFGLAIYMAILLIQAANQLSIIGSSGSADAVDQFIILNKRYWMIIGILIIIYIVMIILMFTIGSVMFTDLMRGF